MQSQASIEDQVRLYQRLAGQHGWSVIQTYTDAGISGSSLLRPGYHQMVSDARQRHVHVVLSEGLDRISRDNSTLQP